VVPGEFFDGRWIGHVPIDSAVQFVDVDDPATHAAVDVTLRRTLRELGVKRAPFRVHSFVALYVGVRYLAIRHQ